MAGYSTVLGIYRPKINDATCIIIKCFCGHQETLQPDICGLPGNLCMFLKTAQCILLSYRLIDIYILVHEAVHPNTEIIQPNT